MRYSYRIFVASKSIVKSNHLSRLNILTGALLLCLFTLAFSCNEKPKIETSTIPAAKTNSVQKKKFTADMVDNKKDPSCGMPMSAGIEDTVHYNGKVYGVCSEECKQAFLKNPAALAKNTEMKN
jgi:YHS domain-containing protein